MSWKDKVKGMLFEQENNRETEKPSQQPAEGAKMQSSVSSVSGINEVGVGIDEGLLDTLEKKLRDANIPGPDYLELKEAAEEKTFVADEPDEAKRWRQAFRNMKAYFPQAGVTKKKILDAIDHYIGIVRQEIQIGQSELRELNAKNVTGESEAVAKLEIEIEKLRKELESKEKQRESKIAKIEESRLKYEHQEAVFVKTTDFVIKMLESDKQKINNYIAE